eukprot:gene7746-9746_t
MPDAAPPAARHLSAACPRPRRTDTRLVPPRVAAGVARRFASAAPPITGGRPRPVVRRESGRSACAETPRAAPLRKEALR